MGMGWEGKRGSWFGSGIKGARFFDGVNGVLLRCFVLKICERYFFPSELCFL